MEKLNIWDKKTVRALDNQCFYKDGKPISYLSSDFTIDQIKKVIADKGQVSILDYGCGTGRNWSIIQEKLSQDELNNIVYFGVDTSESMIELAKQKHDKVFFDVIEVGQSEFDNTFDIVLCTDVIQHHKEPLELIGLIASIPSSFYAVEFWYNETGQDLDKTDRVVKFDLSGTNFIENVYNPTAVNTLAEKFVAKVAYFDAKPFNRVVLYDLKEVKQIEEVQEVKKTKKVSKKK